MSGNPNPHIPRSLRDQNIRASVHARFDVSANGSVQVTLMSSTGNADFDQSVLSTLRGWRWSPALRDGIPYATSERLRIDISN
jgi:protein TonB